MLLQFFAFINPYEILIDFLQDELRKSIEDGIVFCECLGLLQQISSMGRSRKGSPPAQPGRPKGRTDGTRSPLGRCLPEEWDTHETRILWRLFQNQVMEPTFEASNSQSQRAGFIVMQIGHFLVDLKTANASAHAAMKFCGSLGKNMHCQA